ncbi:MULTISPECIES: hypothetical protein [Asaia]|uniref:hypothetical protein n=1 Tax=Asaia TaxID=91914 RepID=UPI002556D226|nr:MULTISPECIES: hypothetical protein [Asaia]MDL2169823.1 hypothetical protein [Asaia sp. HumB]MDR6182053.1 putative DNA-binding transcriptional regulator AlpA [Asaia bogorensis NBRC 16594]
METFEFSIVASGLDRTAEDFESRFYDGGCDDATVSFQKGHIILDFAREAPSLEQAIESAMADVRAAGATINRVEPDPLVSLTEIAQRSGMTKAAISLYAADKRGSGFPAPAFRVTSSMPLWEWSAVTKWMVQNGKMLASDLLQAETIRSVNVRLQREIA